jgi:GMP synthase (glutamine-hydrolysing)
MILLISTCSDRISEEEFVMPIKAIIGKGCITTHYSKLTNEELEKCEKIIICGTALRDNKYIKDIKKFDWIKITEKPVLGICSGMQVIALQFGAKLAKKKEIGMVRIRVKAPSKLFLGDFEAYELHGNGLENLGEFDILAESENCVQAIRHKKKEIYGIMFHPEVRNEGIIRNFIS